MENKEEKEFIIKMIVEIPKGTSNKIEYDIYEKEWRLDRVLPGAVFYPEEYGFIPETIDYDGDPLDIICLTTYRTFSNCIINSRVIGVLRMIDQGQKDYKIIAVNNNDSRFSHIREIDDIGEGKKHEIKNFQIIYKENIEIKGYGDKKEALSIIKECSKLYINLKDKIEKGNKEIIVNYLNNLKEN